jgi:hypothetical protein
VVNFGLRTLLLLAGVLLFILAAITDENYGDLIASGLAVVAASFLLADMGWDRRYGGRKG